nr:hypothetical protein RF1 [Caryocar glabrum]YP_010284511.1 hypothetical protein RF1 [Caryocar glabrum]UKQ56241.1 hypothetical protein RF1 [Caryocar glabrum]UKQ56253.1 hypothetical protein RF1 [Caryocar glabrum]
MIFKSFILGNLVSLCMKIINSVVVVGLYYGFLTTFSMGPSYLFLLRARVIEEGEEGTEKKVSATTGFITGQLMVFISIYYAPLHLALGRPHTITVLALPYLLFHFFWNNHKHFFDYGSTTRNSMRNLSIQCVFLNNLIFQLFNHFILPSSMLVRLVNIYMFRCNNKMLFVTSGFVGWLIGHILFMKWVGLILVWIQQNNSIRSNKYLVSELKNSMARIFSILLFITCVYSLGRIPSPIFTKKLKETSETEEREEETDVEIETTSETKGTKQEQEGSIEEDPSSSLFSEEKGDEDPDKIDETEEIRVNGKEKTKEEFHFHFKATCYKKRPVYETSYPDGNQENSKLEILIEKKVKDLFWFQKPQVTILFDYKRWTRPFRYIKNNQFENAVRKEMSQYFFYTCRSDGKERISFTYPPSLSTFLEMIQRKMSFFTIEKLSSDELYNRWNSKNKQKKKNLSNEFINRVEALDKRFLILTLNTLEKRTRLCNDKTKKQYLSKIYDPLLNGPFRGRIKKSFSPSIINETSIKNYIEMVWINKIHLILLITNYQKLEPKMDKFNRKFFSREIGYFLNLINEFYRKSTSSFNFKELFFFPDQKEKKMNSEDRIKFFKFLFNAVISDPKNQKLRKKSTGIKEISKKVPRWSYKLIDDLEQQEGENEGNLAEDHEIRSRKSKRVVIFTDNQQNFDIYNNTQDPTNSDQADEVAVIRYSQQSDFRRDIIKGSMRTQRRKTAILELFQANAHSPFFLDRINKPLFFSFDISELMKILFINWIRKNAEFTISEYTEEKTKESDKKNEDKNEEDKKEKAKRGEKGRLEIAEAWDSILFAQVIRGCVLLTQSIIRKYILLPSLIIVKNIIRILFFQVPEWSKDFKDWKREMHVKCTYNGVQLSETEFPKNWLTEGIQIKILFPFRLKPWHRSKLKFPPKNRMKKKKKRQKNDFCFLTVWGMEADLPFGSPRKRLSFFEPIFKQLEKKIRKLKKKCFLVITNLNERKKLFLNLLNLSKEKKNWVIKNILFRKEIRNKLSKSKINPILVFGFSEVYELNESKKEKDSIINNQTIPKLSTKIQPMNWTNYSLTEKKLKDLTARTSAILNQIEKITKEKKKGFRTSERNISSNKISCNTKRLKSLKKISQILKRKNARLVRKSNFFIKILIERVYIDIFLGIINIPRSNVQLFLESTKRFINKYIYNNEENNKRIDKRNQNTIHFISIIKNTLNNISIINKNLQAVCDVSSLSQAYVFYKLSQIQVINLYKLKSVLQYNGTSLFLKNEIKDYFGDQGLFHPELKDKNFLNSRMNQWKNWLRSDYQYKYDLPQMRWFRLIAQKWRNRINHRINQCTMVPNKGLTKCNLYEKTQLIHYEKKNYFDFETYSLPNQKNNFKKDYIYNLLSYKSINYEDKKDSYIYRSPFQVNTKQEISYKYKTHENQFFDMLGGILLNNYLAEDGIIDMAKSSDRKYFDWRILHFCLTQKIDIESWIDTGTKHKKNTKPGTNKYQIIDKIDKKDRFFLTIHQQNKEVNSSNQKKNLFDWMGMNEEILNRPISNLELWFFPKFVILYNVYKRRPWVIPIQLLLLNFNRNENISENIKINGKKTSDLFLSLSSSEKKYQYIELETRNNDENEKESGYRGHFGSVLANQEKDVEEDYTRLDMKKRRKKKQYKSNTEVELDSFLKRYLCFQLRWNNSLNQNQKIINNIKVYCLLLRLPNPREILISSIQRGEISLDILIIQKNFTLTELMKKGILIIEPVRLSVQNDGQFILYQTVGIFFALMSKEKINQRYREKSYVDKKNFTESIERHQSITGNRDKNDYDLLVPENILSPKRRRELRILISFTSKNLNAIHINKEIFNGNKIKNYGHILDKSKHFDRDKKKLIQSKLFLWPNYRLEDLACMNRYWFDTNNASRFSMVRIHIYPRLKTR